MRDALTEQMSLHEEFEAIAVENGSKGVQAAKARQIDLVSRDVGLPDIDGRESVRILRKNGLSSRDTAQRACRRRAFPLKYSSRHDPSPGCVSALPVAGACCHSAQLIGIDQPKAALLPCGLEETARAPASGLLVGDAHDCRRNLEPCETAGAGFQRADLIACGDRRIALGSQPRLVGL
jgi:hypothetical protein